MRFAWCIVMILFSCNQRQSEQSTPTVDTTTSNPVTTEDGFEKKEAVYDYREFIGVYDHESTTTGFAAVLVLRQNGNDMYFTVSVAQGNCKGETEGVVMIIEQNENYLSGFYESDNCRLQFTLQRTENKVDVKEITLCQLLGAACTYEGTYVKRRD